MISLNRLLPGSLGRVLVEKRNRAAILVFFILLPGFLFIPIPSPSIFLPGGVRHIPVIEVPIVYGDDGIPYWDTSHLGANLAGHLQRTSYPGQPGNSVIVGHSYGDFGILHEAEVGEVTTYYDQGQVLIYYLESIQVVERVGGSHWARDKGDERLTLITSVNNLQSRVLVFKRLKQ